VATLLLLSAVLAANGQFLHFPVQSGRPDSGQRTQAVAAPQDLDEDYNEVETVPELPQRLNRGRGRGRGTPQADSNRGAERSREISRPSTRVTDNQPASRVPVRRPAPAQQRRTEFAPQRRPEVAPQRRPEVAPQRRPEVAPQRRPEVTPQRRPEVTPQRRPEVTPQRRPEVTQQRRPEPTPSQSPKRQRIRIKTKRPESRTEDPPAPAVRQRQRIQQTTTEKARPAEITTTAPPLPPTPPTVASPVQVEDTKQTFGQSLTGIFDPNTLTVFGDTRVQPRLLPQPQFQIPEVTAMRKLPEPRVLSINEVKDIPEFSNVRKLAEPKIINPNIEKKQEVKVTEEARLIVRPQPVRDVPVPESQQTKGRDQPNSFTFFQAKPQPRNSLPRPVEIQSQPAQLPKLQSQPIPFNPQPQSQPQPIPFKPQPQPQPQPIPFKPQPSLPTPSNTFQTQPVIRQPQPINLQSRPAVAAPPPPPQNPAAQDNFFQERGSLFSQPIEIPAEAGGASFSYEAIVG